MRPIDADALLEELPVHPDGGMRSVKDECLMIRVRQTVRNAPTIGDWISADKRPPKQGRYLVWGLTRVIPDHNDEPNGYWQTKIAQWFERVGWDCKVKFWQMLPEPPKEDDT